MPSPPGLLPAATRARVRGAPILHPAPPPTSDGERAALRSIAVHRALSVIVPRARRDPATFARFVLRDEQDGSHIKLAPVHEAWHRILTERSRVVIWSHLEAGKTNQVSIARVLWELGHNPNLRIVILSSTTGGAKKIIRVLGQYILRSRELHIVFPHLRPSSDPSAPWNQTMLTVERSTLAKDPSVQAVGPRGHIVGARIDLLVLDDFLDEQNVRTQADLDGMYRWLRRSAIGRVQPGGRVWCVGNAWNPRDTMHRLVEEAGYAAVRSPVVTDTGELTWPERWPRERIEQMRKELGAAEFARQLLCLARDDGDSRFKRESLDRALLLGAGYRMVREVRSEDLPPGFGIFTGVDLAVQRHAGADLSALFTILVYPWDHPDMPGARQVLWVEAGRWSALELVQRIDDHAVRYNGLVVVENVAAQDYLLQFAAHFTRANLVPFTTGKNKADPVFGVEGVATEFDNGRWVVPNDETGRDPEVDAWFADMLFYSPNKHTGDRLMAAWFAREGARRWELQMKRRGPATMRGGGARVLGV